MDVSLPRPTARKLLAWYDRHRRDLAWRAGPGEAIDPYRVWLSEIMLQQTTVTAVTPYFEKFLTLWPDVESLAAASQDEVLVAWAGLGYYSRARNLHACADSICKEWGGQFPECEKDLLTLPGVGAYTAAAIASIAFGESVPVVDGNVERVMTRQFALATPLPKVKREVKEQVVPLVPKSRPGDFAQAMMDLGATVCTPRSPKCDKCPWSASCVALGSDSAEAFPVRPPKKQSQRAGALPGASGEKMAQCSSSSARKEASSRPCGSPQRLSGKKRGARTAFAAKRADRGAPLTANWDRIPGLVTHTFTHFHLEVVVYESTVSKGVNPQRGQFVTPQNLAKHALPSVMKKILTHGSS